MVENSGIEWTTHTFNPWIGCTKVSPGCDHCYAETQMVRRKFVKWGANAPRRRTSDANWKTPLKWNKDARQRLLAWDTFRDGLGVSDEYLIGNGYDYPKRPRVFCASLADVFDNQVPEQWRHDLWHLIYQTPHLDWLLLTKRPQNIAKMLPDDPELPAWGAGWPNVWLGTSAENADEYRRRWHHLAAIPARVRFLSAEPLLSDLGDLGLDKPGAPNWIIVGGESGAKARPLHPAWARNVRDQCRAAGAAFFFKQWGEHLIAEKRAEPDFPEDFFFAYQDGHLTRRVGKKAAGARLDGKSHQEYPATVEEG